MPDFADTSGRDDVGAIDLQIIRQSMKLELTNQCRRQDGVHVDGVRKCADWELWQKKAGSIVVHTSRNSDARRMVTSTYAVWAAVLKRMVNADSAWRYTSEGG